ncbi:MAG: M3 family metallopeptidase [Bacteroidaceae bacterium]|nr:M3 family metallopeptidase [Bacteroidaceae bacterium]
MKKIIIMAAVALTLFSCEKRENPLLVESSAPFGAPEFSKIQSKDYLPAFKAAFKQQREEIDAIAENEEAPTYANTIDALEKSGRLLARVQGIFFNVNETDADDTMKETEKIITPMLTDQAAYMTMNEKLFMRIRTIYNEKNLLGLTREQEMVLDKYYRLFVRGGALLSESQKAELLDIDKKLSLATLQFGDNSLAETNAYTLLITDTKDLSGLPDDVIASAHDRAEAAGKEGWLFTLQKPSWEPFLKYADNRDLRREMYLAYTNRGNHDNDNDNKALIKEILSLRLQKAKLFGYKNFAEYQLEDKMAKNPEAAYSLLMKIWEPALAKAKQEAADLQQMIYDEGNTFQLEGWDWWYYSEKLRQQRYALDANELKPYFSLDNVRKGVFMVTNKLYGVSFRPLTVAGVPSAPKNGEINVNADAPDVYHPEVSCYEVLDADGSHLALYYCDYFPRATKRVGAWMNNFVEAIHLDDVNEDPVIVNVCNFTTPTGDTPSLLSIDETRTLFHEFGHATHGFLTKCHYPMVSGTSVARDFVELPSQILEHWAVEPEVMKQYAFHYQTGEVIPDSLIEKMQRAGSFNTGFETTELVAAALLDLEFHMQSDYSNFDAESFEKAVADKLGLIPQIAFRYRSTYFNHIFSGGYSAGYYSYLWAEVLDADAFEAFVESGDIMNEELGRSFRKNVLEMGGSEEPMELYHRFRGADPNPEALLRTRGLVD